MAVLVQTVPRCLCAVRRDPSILDDMLASTSSSTLARPAVDPRLALSLLAVYVIWGSTYLATRFAVHELPPLLMASMRFSAAGLVMLLIALRRGAAWPSLRDWLRVLPIGALLAMVGGVLGERLPLHASTGVWLAVGYLFLFGSLIGFTAYNWLLRNARPVVATSYAYVNPILAVVIGAVLSGEPLGATTLVANLLIVLAVILVLRRPRAKAAV